MKLVLAQQAQLIQSQKQQNEGLELSAARAVEDMALVKQQVAGLTLEAEVRKQTQAYLQELALLRRRESDLSSQLENATNQHELVLRAAAEAGQAREQGLKGQLAELSSQLQCARQVQIDQQQELSAAKKESATLQLQVAELTSRAGTGASGPGQQEADQLRGQLEQLKGELDAHKGVAARAEQ